VIGPCARGVEGDEYSNAVRLLKVGSTMGTRFLAGCGFRCRRGPQVWLASVRLCATEKQGAANQK